MAVRRRKSRSLRVIRRRRTHRLTPRRRVRRARRNPYPVAGIALNPRHRRRTRRHLRNPRRHRRHSYRRNPAILGITLPPLSAVLYTGAGILGTPMVEGFVSKFLPTSITGSTVGKYAVRIGSVLALSFLAKMVIGREQAKAVAIGGGAYVLTSAIAEFAPQILPSSSMGSYSMATAPGMGAYAPSSGNTFNTMRGLRAPAFGSDFPPGNQSARRGGMFLIPQRYRRFQ